jgi:hypothetical protein
MVLAPELHVAIFLALHLGAHGWKRNRESRPDWPKVAMATARRLLRGLGLSLSSITKWPICKQ